MKVDFHPSHSLLHWKDHGHKWTVYCRNCQLTGWDHLSQPCRRPGDVTTGQAPPIPIPLTELAPDDIPPETDPDR